MTRIILAGIASLAASTAMAADVIYQEPAPLPMDVVSAVSWEGFYAGVQAGYGFGSAGDISIDPFTVGLQTAFAPGFSSSFSDGFVGGAHVGYDWQANNIVFGVLTDFNYSNIGDLQVATSTTPANYIFDRDLDWYGTIRGRVGVAFGGDTFGGFLGDNVLAYVTGGAAYGRYSVAYSQPGSGATATVSGDRTEWGYTVGGGLEMLLTDNVSFGIEYLYTDLGNDIRADLVGGPFGGPGGDPGSSAGGTTLTPSDFDFHTVTARISYRF